MEVESKQMWGLSANRMPEPFDTIELWNGVWVFELGRAVAAGELYSTELAAIVAARKLRIDEIQRLQQEVNALSDRLDQIETEEVNNGNNS
jgi:hypothetical protein